MACPVMRVLGVLVAVVSLLRGTAACAQAPALQISPVMMQMAAGEMATTLSVTNAGDSETTVQLRTFLWQQDGGADRLTPTDELDVSPPITEIPAGQTQIFRLVLRKPAGEAEASYRILLDQIPGAGQPSMVRIAVRISLPLFAASAVATAPDVVWHLGLQDGHMILAGTNQGTRHARVLNPVLRDRGHLPVTARPLHGPYILPGMTQTWLVDDRTRIASGATLRLMAQSDAGKLDTTVAAPGR